MMINAEKRKNRKFGRILVTAGIFVLVFAFYTDMRVRPLIETITEYQCRVAAVRIINEAVFAELNSVHYDYNNLINVSYGAGGEIKSITGDMQTINRLKSRSTLLINEAVAGLDSQNINISLGTASGFSFMYGKGPTVPVRILPKGYANAVLISDFSSAGINQTLHKIIMEVEVDITAVIPGFNKNMTVKTDFIVAQTVIVGKVPLVNMQISGNGDLIHGN